MMRCRTGWIGVLSVVALAACAKSGEPAPDSVATAAAVVVPDAAADESAIRAGDAEWFKAYNAHDVDGVVALYAEDAVLAIPGAQRAQGSTAIRAALQKDIQATTQAGYTIVEGASHEVAVSGDLAYVSNTFAVKDKTGKTVDTGKYLTVLGRRDGKWLIVRDIWNTDSPPAPAQGT